MQSFTDKYSFGINSNEEELNEHFDVFLARLRANSYTEWGILDRLLRKKTIPWLCGKLSNSPKYRYGVAIQIAEEVYSDSIQTYIRLVESGTFESVSNLVSLMYSVADRKLKERYRKITKDGRFVFTDNDDWMQSFEDPYWNEEEQQTAQNEQLSKMRKHLQDLSEKDRQILLRFANGEKLKDIADSLNIPEATCRKQKERALKRLKKSFFNTKTSTKLISIIWLLNF